VATRPRLRLLGLIAPRVPTSDVILARDKGGSRPPAAIRTTVNGSKWRLLSFKYGHLIVPLRMCAMRTVIDGTGG
jgi:hypothetical protein